MRFIAPPLKGVNLENNSSTPFSKPGCYVQGVQYRSSVSAKEKLLLSLFGEGAMVQTHPHP